MIINHGDDGDNDVDDYKDTDNIILMIQIVITKFVFLTRNSH